MVKLFRTKIYVLLLEFGTLKRFKFGKIGHCVGQINNHRIDDISFSNCWKIEVNDIAFILL